MSEESNDMTTTTERRSGILKNVARTVAGGVVVLGAANAPDNSGLPTPHEVAAKPVNPQVRVIDNPFAAKTADARGLQNENLSNPPVEFFSKEIVFTCENPHLGGLPEISIKHWRYNIIDIVFPKKEGGFTSATQAQRDIFLIRAKGASRMDEYQMGTTSEFAFLGEAIVMPKPYEDYVTMDPIHPLLGLREVHRKFDEEIRNKFNYLVSNNGRAGFLGLMHTDQIPGYSYGSINTDFSSALIDPSVTLPHSERGGQILISHEMGRMKGWRTNNTAPDREVSVMTTIPEFLYNRKLKQHTVTEISQTCKEFQVRNRLFVPVVSRQVVSSQGQPPVVVHSNAIRQAAQRSFARPEGMAPAPSTPLIN